MNWEAIGAIGEVAGAIGVIATLLYLAVQIRQNTRAIRLNTFHSISEGFRSQASLVGGSELVAAVYLMGLTRPEELSQAEGVQFYALMHNQVRGYEDAFYQHSEGALDARYWAGMHGQMISTSSQPGFGQYWKDRRGWYSESFQCHVDDVLIPSAEDFVLGGSAEHRITDNRG